jgi:Zn-dependent protease
VFGMTADELILGVVLVAVFLLVAFPVHEFAHAYAAYRLGDGTAKMFGRLSLNPVVHFDPLGGLLLTITALSAVVSSTGMIFGYAKPTPVNPNNLRDRRNGEVIVALAGPASNLVMAVIGGVTFRLLVASSVEFPQLVWQAIALFVQVNIVLAVFNMIPIPPLDGSALLFRVVSPATAWQLRPMLAQYGNILLIGLIFALILTPLGRGLGELIGGITNLLLGI